MLLTFCFVNSILSVFYLCNNLITNNFVTNLFVSFIFFVYLCTRLMYFERRSNDGQATVKRQLMLM